VVGRNDTPAVADLTRLDRKVADRELADRCSPHSWSRSYRRRWPGGTGAARPRTTCCTRVWSWRRRTRSSITVRAPPHWR